MIHHLRSTPLGRPGLGRALAALLLAALPSAGLGGCGGSGSGSSGGGSFGGAGLRVYVETGPDNDRGVYVARYDGGAVPLHRGPMSFSLRRGSVRDAFSADGEWALYVGNDGDEQTADVVVVRLSDGARRVLDSFALPVTLDAEALLNIFSGVLVAGRPSRGRESPPEPGTKRDVDGAPLRGSDRRLQRCLRRTARQRQCELRDLAARGGLRSAPLAPRRDLQAVRRLPVGVLGPDLAARHLQHRSGSPSCGPRTASARAP